MESGARLTGMLCRGLTDRPRCNICDIWKGDAQGGSEENNDIFVQEKRILQSYFEKNFPAGPPPWGAPAGGPPAAAYVGCTVETINHHMH